MDRGAWKKPVALEMYGRPGIIRVGDTLDAALLLLGGWHSRRTDAHTTAVLTCRDVLRGKAQPGLARAVFIDAVLDAGYHILPETFLEERWGPPAGAEGDRGYIFPRADSPIGLPRSPSLMSVQARKVTAPSSNAEHVHVSALIGRLGETLMLIAVEIFRSAIGLLNIEVRRKPRREIR
jgi:hypothetical protein